MSSKQKGKTRTRIAAFGGLAMLLSALLVPIGAETATAAEPATRTWSSPGTYTYTVPQGVERIQVTVAGGSGGNRPLADVGGGTVGAYGGYGDELSGTLSVSPGQQYTLHVASSGYDGATGGGGNSYGRPGTGYRNGGQGGTGSGSSLYGQGGGGGGGASAMLRGSTRIAVAGGGGGAGGSAWCGGNPGGNARGSGWKTSKSCSSNGGDPGHAGHTSSGTGENGDGAGTGSGQGGGGGGGGGVRGGGGADASTDGGGGGGGGTSMCNLSGCTMNATNWGNGSIRIVETHSPVVTFDEDSYGGVTGTAVSFTGTVSTLAASAPTPQGTVDLFAAGDGGDPQLLATLPVSAHGTFVHECGAPCGIDPTDSNRVVAEYRSANPVAWTNASGSANMVMTAASTQTALHVDPLQVVTGQDVDLHATVSIIPPASGTLTGEVEFFTLRIDGSESRSLGTAALNASNQAQITTSALTTGQHRFWAEYVGAGGFLGSESPRVTISTAEAATGITAVATPDPSIYGQIVNVSGALDVRSPGGGIPTGTVMIEGGDKTVDTVLDATGAFSVDVEGLDAGDVTFTIRYLGDGNYSPSATTVDHETLKADVDLALGISAPTSVYGEDVNLEASASVIAPGAGELPGSIQFGMLDGDGTFEALGDPVPLADGTAGTTLTGLDAGTYRFEARYAGSDNFNAAASPTVTHEIVADDTVVTIDTYRPTFPLGGVQEMIVRVEGTVSETPILGTVQIVAVGEPGDEVAILGEADLDETGIAVVEIDDLDVGPYTVYAAYSGSANHEPASTEPVEFEVTPAPSRVVLDGPNTSEVGDEVEFTVDVRALFQPQAMLFTLEDTETVLPFDPDGTVTFLVDGEPVEADVALESGVAVLTHAFDDAGTFEVTAVYSGEERVEPGESNVIEMTVSERPAPVEPTPEEPEPVEPELVEQTPEPPHQGGLARTGFDVGFGAAIAMPLLVAGAGLAAIRRRDAHRSSSLEG